MTIEPLWMIAALLLIGLATSLLLRRHRVSPIWMMMGALALGVLTALVARREPLDDLTVARLESARMQWAHAALEDYDLEVLVRADRLEDGRFELRVRRGEVVGATQNGLATSNAGAYSIAGLFDILARELELAGRPAAGFGAPEGYRAYLRVRFHAETGYPEKYRRSVGGTSNGVEITVIRLTPRS
ncbi:MAG: hypothetical protein ACE5G2_07010 [Candidatus Krumholzibacteriia bacterium]